MLQAHIFVSGDVQGVGFRQFVRYHARKLGITGWVKNLSDGRVEAVLQSFTNSNQEHDEKIAKLLMRCRKGPLIARVEKIAVSWEEKTESFTEFLIRKE